MSAPARIATALCLLALGISGAWLFRKPPANEVSLEAGKLELGKTELMLRDPRGPSAALVYGEEAWRPAIASPRAASKSPLASIGVNALGSSAPPLPVPRAAVAGPVNVSDELAGTGDGLAAHQYSADVSGADDEPILHVVVDGDSLETLAKQYLGDPGRASEILAANRESIRRSDLLPIGVTLRIPCGSRTNLPAAARDGTWRKAGNGRP
jgi:hypothetical protein